MRNLLTLKQISALLVAASVLGGCTTVNTTERQNAVGQRDMVADKRVITDKTLHHRVRILGVNATEGAGGLLQVQVELLNTTSRRQAVYYQWEWFDENGMIVKGPTTINNSREFDGKESVFITAMAPNAKAKDFRLKLIEVR